MSFRIEDKLFIKNESILDFKKFLKEKSVKKLYEPRIVKSLYFENSKYQMYEDSIEGIVPRKKIRIRNYPDQKINKFHNLETKISSEEGRYKIKKKLLPDKMQEMIKFGFLDNQYGVCYPKLFVSYLREYSQIDDVRITIDSEIKYKKYVNNFFYKDKNIVIELKTNIKKDMDDLVKNFPFQRLRISKYCNAIKFLNYK